MDSVGLSLFAFCPITFVSIKGIEEGYHNLFAKLEVVSAGILNNALLCLVLLICYAINPIALLYTPANGLLVIDIDPVVISLQRQNKFF